MSAEPEAASLPSSSSMVLSWCSRPMGQACQVLGTTCQAVNIFLAIPIPTTPCFGVVGVLSWWGGARLGMRPSQHSYVPASYPSVSNLDPAEKDAVQQYVVAPYTFCIKVHMPPSLPSSLPFPRSHPSHIPGKPSYRRDTHDPKHPTPLPFIVAVISPVAVVAEICNRRSSTKSKPLSYHPNLPRPEERKPPIQKHQDNGQRARKCVV